MKVVRRIVVLGSTNTDMVIAGRKIPRPGETVSGGKFLMNPGGKGANQAVAVALGANGTLVPKDIVPYRKDIENAAALLMQLETPIRTVVAAMLFSMLGGFSAVVWADSIQSVVLIGGTVVLVVSGLVLTLFAKDNKNCRL